MHKKLALTGTHQISYTTHVFKNGTEALIAFKTLFCITYNAKIMLETEMSTIPGNLTLG